MVIKKLIFTGILVLLLAVTGVFAQHRYGGATYVRLATDGPPVDTTVTLPNKSWAWTMSVSTPDTVSFQFYTTNPWTSTYTWIFTITLEPGESFSSEGLGPGINRVKIDRADRDSYVEFFAAH